MEYLLFILLAAALLIGFLTLTWYEERRGARVFAAASRSRLDTSVTRMTFILTHVDFGAFVREELKRLASRISHALVTLSLSLVRALERLLTRLMRYLRTRHPVDTEPISDTRPFLKTLSAFKDRLKKTEQKHLSDIE